MSPSAARLRPSTLTAVVAVLALGACPLPQPLTEVANSSGETTPPPRILAGSVAPAEAHVRVSRSCPAQPRFTFKASVHDDNAAEQVDARWFIDYATDQFGSRTVHQDVLAPPEDPAQLDRPIPPWTLVFPVGDTASVHVVELVVSNGFYAIDDPAAVLPNRSAQPGYETQVFRWVFEYVDGSGVCQ